MQKALVALVIGMLWVPLKLHSQDWPGAGYKAGFESRNFPQADSTDSWFERKLFYEDLVAVDNEGLMLKINPLMHMYGGKSDKKEQLIYRNTRGVKAEGQVGNHVSFQTSFYETQLNAPVWMDNYYSKYGVLPGETHAKGYGEDGYDMGSVYGSFEVNQRIGSWALRFKSGYDNLFVGEGFRSLFLSDYSLPFLFGSVQISKGHFDYLHLTASMQNPNFRNVFDIKTSGKPVTAPYQKKTYSMHYLRYRISDKVRAGLFEATVYQVSDSAHRKFSLQYINPVIYSNVAAYGLNNRNNVMLGLDLLLNYWDSFSLYLQYVQDAASGQGYGILGSLRYSGQKVKLLLEASHTGNAVLAHKDPRQSFTHYNQPLTHGAGAGVGELVAEAGYRLGRMELEGRWIYQKHEQMAPYTVPDKLLMMEGAEYQFYTTSLRYVFNPQTRLQAFGDFIYVSGNETDDRFFRFGLKTQLRRSYEAVVP